MNLSDCLSQKNNFSDSDIMNGMSILNLLDTEYLDEFDYGNILLTPVYEIEEEPEPKVTPTPNSRYTYYSMLPE